MALSRVSVVFSSLLSVGALMRWLNDKKGIWLVKLIFVPLIPKVFFQNTQMKKTKGNWPTLGFQWH